MPSGLQGRWPVEAMAPSEKVQGGGIPAGDVEAQLHGGAAVLSPGEHRCGGD